MEIIYSAWDKISQMEIKKRIVVSTLSLIGLAVALLSLYILFRTYNLIGLATTLFIYFMLVFRASFIELFEFNKPKNEN